MRRWIIAVFTLHFIACVALFPFGQRAPDGSSGMDRNPEVLAVVGGESATPVEGIRDITPDHGLTDAQPDLPEVLHPDGKLAVPPQPPAMPDAASGATHVPPLPERLQRPPRAFASA